MRIKRIVIAIYVDPDFYPPTISAILNFAERSEEVIVICRNNIADNYNYPQNVYLKKIGPLCTVREMEQQSARAKAYYFLKFAFCLFRYSIVSKCQLVVLYDHIALFAFFRLKSFLRRKKIWYHNHDMPIKELIRSRSLGGFAASYEKKGMKFIDFFSLPSKERLEFYPGINLPVFIIPNYPSLKVYKDYSIERKAGNSTRIIYQGFIGKGHSLEHIIEAIGKRTKDLKIELILKGSVTTEYKMHLNQLAGDYGVRESIVWIPVGPYKELPSLTESCHIGIGMNWNTDIVNKNQGTASNKIYEYAASGAPVILADTPQFRQYLRKYSWAFFSDGSADSLTAIIKDICDRKIELGADARNSFKKELNFEKVFVPVMGKVMASMTEKEEAC